MTNPSHYSFSNRYKGEVSLSLFDKYYLKVKEKKRNRSREFKLELAILDPEAVHVKSGKSHWLVTALLVGAVDAFLLYDMTSVGSLGLDPLIMLIAVAGATVLTALFVGLYVTSMQSKWVLNTRASHYPLIEVPYARGNKAAAKQFVEELQASIHRNVLDKDYSNDTLLAGEMRMLRRLVKKKVLSEKSYDKAKQQMLAAH